MTDEERQQAEAYIKLQDNVNELIDERASRLMRQYISSSDFKIQIFYLIEADLQNNPMNPLGKAIANHVRFLNKENIK